MVSLCCVWGWPRVAAGLLLGFCGLLHPGEVLEARRRHLRLPDPRLPDNDPDAYLHIPSPKTRRFARQQHARIDDPIVIEVLRAVFGRLGPNEALVAGGVAMFRRRWDALCAQLGLPHAAPHGVTPAVLRGSGATYLYRCRVPICDIAWRGRWRQIRNLEYYLQEVAGTDLLQSLPPQPSTESGC